MNFSTSQKLIIQLIASLSVAVLIACNTSVDEKIEEVKPSQIKIGILAPITGPLAGFGQDMEATARLAANEINNAGGVNGQEIGFLVRDTRLALDDSSQVSLEMAQQLIDEGVVGIIGPAGSGTTINISPTTIANGVPIISPSATSPALSTLDDADLVWRSVASDAFQGKFLADKLIDEQVSTIGIIYRDDAYGSGLKETIIERFTELGGNVLTSVSYPASKSTGFDSEVNELFSNGNPDALVIISFVTDGANIIISLANANVGNMPALYGVDGNNRDEFIANSPSQLILGMKGSAPTAPSGSLNYITFTNTYHSFFGNLPPVFTESVYDAVYLLALSMSVGGENTSIAIRDNLRALSKADTDTPLVINVGPTGYANALQNLSADLDLEGAAGSIGYDENGDVTSGNYIFWEIVEQNGELVYQVIDESPFP